MVEKEPKIVASEKKEDGERMKELDAQFTKLFEKTILLGRDNSFLTNGNKVLLSAKNDGGKQQIHIEIQDLQLQKDPTHKRITSPTSFMTLEKDEHGFFVLTTDKDIPLTNNPLKETTWKRMRQRDFKVLDPDSLQQVLNDVQNKLDGHVLYHKTLHDLEMKNTHDISMKEEQNNLNLDNLLQQA